MKWSLAKTLVVVIGGILGVVALLVAGIALAGTAAVQAMMSGAMPQTKSETLNTQVTNAVDLSDQVVLLSLGVQGIEERKDKTTVLWLDIPGSERATFLQYAFTAKLGIEGGAVDIRQTGEKQFTIAIPAFVFIGHDDLSFKLAAESNGILSWVTPEIDTIEMSNKILSMDARQKYVDANQEILKQQAKAFYSGIVNGLDPEIDLTFSFASDR